MVDFIQAIWDAYATGDDKVIIGTLIVALGAIVLWVGKNSVAKIRGDIKDLRTDHEGLKDKVEDFEKEVLRDYATKAQLDSRVGGQEKAISKLTDMVGKLQVDFAVLLSHLGLTSSPGPKAPVKRKVTPAPTPAKKVKK